jgi:hypothetical protein
VDRIPINGAAGEESGPINVLRYATVFNRITARLRKRRIEAYRLSPAQGYCASFTERLDLRLEPSIGTLQVQLGGLHLLRRDILRGHRAGTSLLWRTYDDCFELDHARKAVTHRHVYARSSFGESETVGELVGRERLLGRRVDHYRLVQTGPSDRATVKETWIDERLRIAIQVMLDGHCTYKVDEIMEGAQPLSAFLIPEDYVRIN